MKISTNTWKTSSFNGLPTFDFPNTGKSRFIVQTGLNLDLVEAGIQKSWRGLNFNYMHEYSVFRSGVLALKLMSKPISFKLWYEPTTKKYNVCWFFKILIQKWKSKWEWSKNVVGRYFKELKQHLKLKLLDLEIDGRKSLEVEKQVPGFQLSVNITAEDFDSSFLNVFCFRILSGV